MSLFSFTSRAGSLLHPLLMSTILIGWIITWILGIFVRKNRLSQINPETTPLLSSQSEAPYSNLRKARAHHKLSAALVALTVWTTFLGMGNTFLRSGRLFPGPHLYGGLLFIALISTNLALVPWMTKNSVRLAHAAVGLLAILVLILQLRSGIPILQSVWNTVKW